MIVNLLCFFAPFPKKSRESLQIYYIFAHSLRKSRKVLHIPNGSNDLPRDMRAKTRDIYDSLHLSIF